MLARHASHALRRGLPPVLSAAAGHIGRRPASTASAAEEPPSSATVAAQLMASMAGGDAAMDAELESALADLRGPEILDIPTTLVLDPTAQPGSSPAVRLRPSSEDECSAAAVESGGEEGEEAEDPLLLLQDDVRSLSSNIAALLGNDHPVLEQVSKYYFERDGGKKIRPALVLLMSRALRGAAVAPGGVREADAVIHAKQLRLAEIAEMIHTASLLHDDVIDEADSRRGVPAVNAVFGAKLAILGGDFLLARASGALARLRNAAVTELMSSIIEHLVKGEIMQMKGSVTHAQLSPIDYYLHKSFYKTASLMAHSLRSAAVLGAHAAPVCDAASAYGSHVGLAFQIKDDLLDFEASSDALGKPAGGADLKAGLATAPVLYAMEQFPELRDSIARGFEAEGDVEHAMRCVHAGDAMARTRQLADWHVQQARACLHDLPPSRERQALDALAVKVVQRAK